MSELQLARVVAALEEVSAEWIEKHDGRKPTRLDVEADERWRVLQEERRELERGLAGEPRAGGCQFFIARRRRWCSNFTSETGATLCWLHSQHSQQAPVTNPACPPPSADAIDLSGKKKTNLSRRMKKMTNPQAIQFATPVQAPDWDSLFADSSLPLFLDIGCSRGRFLYDLSQSTEFEREHGRFNFVGVEIFDSLVKQANAIFLRPNLHYLSANINTSAVSLSFPPSLTYVSIQFPDPWHEAKKKLSRRVVNAELANWLSSALPIGRGQVYICSDVHELATEMKNILLATGNFTLAPAHLDADTWLEKRPWRTPSERDIVCEKQWRPVYRALLVRTAKEL